MAAPGRCLYEEMLKVSLRRHITWLNFVKNETEHYFNNLIQLDLSQITIFEDKLKLIIERNTKINHITLGFLELIRGSSLLRVNPILTEVLIVQNFTVDTGETMTKFLSSLTNLRLLEISFLNIEMNNNKIGVINRFNLNQFKFLEFHQLLNKPAFNIIILKGLFINKLPLSGIRLITLPDELIYSTIPWNNISSIFLEYLTEELLNALDKFVNLRYLRGRVGNCTDDEIQNILKCSNLKCLILYMDTFNITEDGVKLFKKFCNLYYLRMAVFSKDGSFHDNSFSAFNKCEKLKTLILSGFQFKKILEYDPFSNLEKFEIHFSNINNSSLKNIVTKSQKLFYCKIRQCKKITKNCISILNHKYPRLIVDSDVERNDGFCIIL